MTDEKAFWENIYKMANKERLETFEKHLNMMQTRSIRQFTEFVVVRFPGYFWTLPASTTNNRHGKSESLIDHVQGCLKVAEKVIEQFKGHWTQRQNDQLLSALILHDGWRCGSPGNERRFTQEDVEKNNYPIEFLGKLRTSKDHPEVGFKQLLSLSSEFNIRAASNKMLQIGSRDLDPILKSVRYHYGPWGSANLPKPFSLSWPFDNVIIQTHLIDYHQAINASLWTR